MNRRSDQELDIASIGQEETLRDFCRLSAKEQNQIISYIGHLPTRFIDGAIPDRIFHRKDTIAIDCGCGFGGRLGVLRLDDMEEMYFLRPGIAGKESMRTAK